MLNESLHRPVTRCFAGMSVEGRLRTLPFILNQEDKETFDSSVVLLVSDDEFTSKRFLQCQ